MPTSLADNLPPAIAVPLVTVIIPNYNHARYLPRRIESVLSQTVSDMEVLILDDCSPDQSRTVIEGYARQDARIRTIYNEQNSGSTFKQWNKGLALARGKYVWIAESDDYAAPTLLATLLARLEANPALGLAYCDSWIVDEKDKQLGTYEYLPGEPADERWQTDFEENGLTTIREYLSYRNVIPNASAAVLRRRVLEQVGPADVSLRLMGDWLFWGKVLAVSDMAFVAQPLNYFRKHSNNVRSASLLNGVALLEETHLLRAMLGYGAPNPLLLEKKITFILRNWYLSWAYNDVPADRYRQMRHNMQVVVPGFQGRFARELGKFLVSNRLGGLRQLIGDGLIYPWLKRKRA
ncbi:glycosyl transferase family 2 [Hymenobacter roseosalivarius DSM 11622]|uniref:Glycosyl transferase family 2 n=1 Tax=Hymenobacter roseosalivarius DSM 11622 TaxID=645990 RepID=A0A1W1V8I9_9BACT|nr:glycosyltransferase [Hymenobacter roseosalivarius]SMB89500.1 glycosyl transferase family 2 [Hymenobacter roseosalivarius DSM 11622]